MPVSAPIQPLAIAANQQGYGRSTYRDDVPLSAPQLVHSLHSAALDFGATIAAGVVEVRTFTLDGAALSDVVVASPEDNPGTGFVWSARVSAADTVEIRLANPTTASITATVRTWHVVITRYIT